jgi:uncharacterized repeat protein (TIGR03803 family)
MVSRPRMFGAWSMAAVIGAAVVPHAAAHPLSFHLLHTFTGPPDGIQPFDGLYRDAEGNLYGTTSSGGDANCPNGGGSGCGTVFEIEKTGGYKVLYSFQGGADGNCPYAGVTGDAAGNLYGATEGINGATGTLFKLTPAGQETVLFSFSNFADGAVPNSTPVLDAAGNLYGTTFYGGDDNCGYNGNGCGVIYKLSANGKFHVMHSFTNFAEGYELYTGVVISPSGTLYGTTLLGGDTKCAPNAGCGAVFKVKPNGKFTVVHRFNRFAEGRYPNAVTLDAAGNLYGTTDGGGYKHCIPDDGGGCGTIFKIDQAGRFSILYTFTPKLYSDGGYDALILDAKGDIFGSGIIGANTSGFVYELDTKGNFTDLLDFPNFGEGGGTTSNNIIRDKQGAFFGTMQIGGEPNCGTQLDGCGTVFKVLPEGRKQFFFEKKNQKTFASRSTPDVAQQ